MKIKKLLTGIVLLTFMLGFGAQAFAAKGLTRGDQTIYGKKTFEHEAVFKGNVTVDGQISGVGTVQYGKEYYIDSGSGADVPHYGNSWEKPFATIEYALQRCTANRGDILYVIGNHALTVTADSGVDLDIAGVSLIGVANGEDRPTITFTTDTAADFKIAAANIRVSGFVFKCNIANQAMMIEITGDDAEIDHCEFREGTATGLNFITIGVADNDADRARIHHNRFYMPTAGNGDSAISFAKDHAGVEITDNYIYGDFDNAAIEIPAGGNAQVDCLIARNYIINNQTGIHAIEVNGTGSTGMIADNRLVTDTIATTVDAGGLSMQGNLYNVTGDSQFEAVPVLPIADQATNFLGVDDNNNVADTSNVVANEDGSILERLEQIQEGINIGSGANLPANKSLFDIIGETYTDDAGGDHLDDVYAHLRLVQEGLEPTDSHPNYIALSVDLTSATWNTQASHEILTVTGNIRLLVMVECTETLTDAADAATISLGDEITVAGIIASTSAAGAGAANQLDAGEFWIDATPADVSPVAYSSSVLDFTVLQGADVGYTIGGEALTDGTLIFHMWWYPLDSTGAAVVGAGGAL